jgi:hypothetical protein
MHSSSVAGNLRPDSAVMSSTRLSASSTPKWPLRARAGRNVNSFMGSSPLE